MVGNDAVQVRVGAGRGLVARYDDVLLVVPELVATQEGRLDELLGLCRAAGRDGSGRRLLRHVARLLVSGDPDELPEFGLLAAVDDAVAVLVTGSVDVLVRRSGQPDERLSGQDSPTWLDRLVRGAQGFEVRAAGAPPGEFLHSSDLLAGVVPGSAVQVSEREAQGAELPDRDGPDVEHVGPGPAADRVEPLTAAMPVPLPGTGGGAEPVPRPGTPAELVELTQFGHHEVREPLPVAGPGRADTAGGSMSAVLSPVLVHGILCPLQHLNDPRGLFCNVCGRSLVQLTHSPVEGDRPSLGVLVLDDATVFSLDADYLIGREPERDEGVASGRLRPLRVDDGNDVASRVHAEIRLQDWDVVVEDRDSANGTYVTPPDSERWEALQPRTPHVLAPGSRVRVGQRVLQFESRHYR